MEERLSILSNQNTLGLFGDIGLIADDELPMRGARYRGIFVDYHFVIENSFFPGCDAYGIKTHNSCNDCEHRGYNRPVRGITTCKGREDEDDERNRGRVYLAVTYIDTGCHVCFVTVGFSVKREG